MQLRKVFNEAKNGDKENEITLFSYGYVKEPLSDRLVLIVRLTSIRLLNLVERQIDSKGQLYKWKHSLIWKSHTRLES